MDTDESTHHRSFPVDLDARVERPAERHHVPGVGSRLLVQKNETLFKFCGFDDAYQGFGQASLGYNL